MNIYFTTHGTSKDNENNIASGWNDTELSETGIRQAKERRETFRDIPIDLVCCSDLKRAVDTVSIAFREKYPVITDKRLREVNYGDYNGMSNETVNPLKKEKISVTFPNGESYRQVKERVHDFCNELLEKFPDKTVLIIGHSATQFALDTLYGGRTMEERLGTPFEWQPYWQYSVEPGR